MYTTTTCTRLQQPPLNCIALTMEKLLRGAKDYKTKTETKYRVKADERGVVAKSLRIFGMRNGDM